MKIKSEHEAEHEDCKIVKQNNEARPKMKIITYKKYLDQAQYESMCLPK